MEYVMCQVQGLSPMEQALGTHEAMSSPPAPEGNSQVYLWFHSPSGISVDFFFFSFFF